ncbi:Teichoic acid biosynthesis protein C (Precursor) [Streptomyces sp. S.PB5]|uniref:phage baseplate protein n=1 Tax=Streptomyces sp. S.PB5 TaxID=3020844 RepID=UPI0025B032B1|nr:Teichoic acid biosynthesis protein C (Precursor) [Streptomyces sp. S.PB5]MDN3022529.1 Teichoic acid biosynthesis protein C (Precursor) [Streptomyces sp. S.PB5]
MTDRIALDVSAKRWLKEKALAEGTVLQSFAFDEVHKHLYVLQVRPGGGESGHLRLNKLDYEGELLGSMKLQGFGHGVSMGVQNAADGKVWIWTEADAKGGYGQGVTRFRFADGATRTGADVNIRKPIPASINNQPSVCMASKRIAVRYRVKGKPRYRVWDLDAFVARDYADPVADIAQPEAHPDQRIPFQGYALYGDHIYQLAGTAYDAEANPPARFGNAYVSSIDITTGELVQRLRTEAGRSLVFREPEGVAVRAKGEAGLFLGFASGAAGERRFSLYRKPLA